MTETYISNGRHYNVSQENLERFLTDHPEAEKKEDTQITAYYNREGDKWKKYNVAGRNLEKFKADFPEARTPEGWDKYGKDQEAKYNAWKKGEKKRKEADKKAAEEVAAQTKKDQEKAQAKNVEKINREFNERYSGEGWDFAFDKVKAKDWSVEQKVEWLNQNLQEGENPMEAQLTFEEPEFDINEDVIDESQLDVPDRIDVDGIEFKELKNNSDTELGDNFLTQINNYNDSIQKVLDNPILDDNGKVDYEATQEAINEVKLNAPEGLEVRTDNIFKGLDEEKDNILSRLQQYEDTIRDLGGLGLKSDDMVNRMVEEEDLVLLNRARELIGMNEEEYNDLLENDKEKLFKKLKSELETKGGLHWRQLESTQLTLEERKTLLEQYQKGEVDLTAEQLSEIAVGDPAMAAYVKRFFPDVQDIEIDSELSNTETVQKTFNEAISKAVMADPRFKFVQSNIQKEVNNNAEAKLIELSKKYKLDTNPTQKNLEKAQDEFAEWYGNSLSEKFGENDAVKRLYKEYGVAGSAVYSELNQDFLRNNMYGGMLRRIDNTLDRYSEKRLKDSDWFTKLQGKWKRGSAYVREAGLGLVKNKAWWNDLQTTVQQPFLENRTKTRDMFLATQDDLSQFDYEGESGDLTVKEIMEMLPSDHPFVRHQKTWRGTRDDDKTLNEMVSSWDETIEDIDESIGLDVAEAMQAYADSAAFKTYDSGKSWYTLEGFLDRTAGLVEQAPHMVPTFIGQALVAKGTLVAATGVGAAPGAATMATGYGFMALGASVQGAMEYSSVYMDAVRRKLGEELGREPTIKEYQKALASGKYGDHGAALATGASVMGTEFLSDAITSKLTGGAGAWLASTPIGRTLIGNTFGNYVLSAGTGYAGMKINAWQEYVTEGFQTYLGEVADNYIQKAEGKDIDSIFTHDINWEEIQHAADMGYKIGELFGGVSFAGSLAGFNQIQKSYTQKAEDVAYKIDMSKGSRTYEAANSYFKKLQKAINEDGSLTKHKKRELINEISRIREASMQVPQNVKSSSKKKLINLLIEQRQLKNDIKSIDNKDLAVNKIERKAIVDEQIQKIIKGADERANTVGMSILPTGQKQTIDTKSETDSYSKLDKLYADEDFDIDNVLDQRRVLKEAGGTINARLNQLWIKDSLLTRDEFKTALENEYLKTFKGYNPDQDVNMQGVGRQTANLFFERSKALVEENKRKDKTISMSDEKAPEISDTTRQKDFDAKTEQVVGKRDKRYIGSNEKVNEAVGGETKVRIQAEAAKQILVQAAKGSTADQTGSFINNMFDHRTKFGIPGMFDILGKKIGSFKKGYLGFIDNVVDAEFISQLPSAYIKQSGIGKLLGVEKIGKSDKVVVKEDGKKSYSRPDTFLLPGEITAEMVEKVKNHLKKDNATRERFLKKLSSEFAMEQLIELKVDKDFMKKLQTALGDTQTAEQFMNDLESKMDQRTLEDSTLDVTTPIQAATKAVEEIITEDTINTFKDKDVLDKAIEYFEDLDDDFKNTLGINPISAFIKAIKNGLKALKRALELDYSLKYALSRFKEVFKNTLKYTKELYQKASKSARITMAGVLKKHNIKAFVPSFEKGDTITFDKIRSKGKSAGINKTTANFGDTRVYTRIETSPEKIRKRRNHTLLMQSKFGNEVLYSLAGGAKTSLYQFFDKSPDGYFRKNNLQVPFSVEADLEYKFNPKNKLDIEDINILKKQGVPFIENSDGTLSLDRSKSKSIDVKYKDANGVEQSTVENARKEQLEYTEIDPDEFKFLVENDPAWRTLQDNKLKVLKNIEQEIEKDVKANPENIPLWAAWLDSQGTVSTHPIRALAPIKFFSSAKGDANLFRAEHALPANQVATMIMDMAIAQDGKSMFKLIEKDYFQGKLLLSDDIKLKKNAEGVNLVKDMPNAYFVGPASSVRAKTWLRYLDNIVNSKEGGINFNEYYVWDSKGKLQTIAEKFGLGLTKDQYEKFPNLGGITLFGLIKFQNERMYDVLSGKMSLKTAKSLLKTAVDSGVKAAEQKMVTKNAEGFGTIFSKFVTPLYQKNTMLNSLAVRIQALKINKKRKGLSAFDMDDTLALTKEKVIAMSPAAQLDLEMINETGNQILREKLKKEFYNSNKVKYLSAAEYAQKYESLSEKGWVFDYKNFDNVDLSTSKGPLAGTALARQAKYGAKDIYIVTARPNASQRAIKIWADSIGLNIPLENIITLEDGSPMAKADWLIEKAKQGYNDFYFADDSAMNVEVVKDILSQIDVKSKVQLAIAEKATDIDTKMNELIEDATDIKANTEVTDVEAALEGKKRDKGFLKRILRQFTITSSADDFLGLGYKLFGFGKKGTDQQTWFIDNLIKPYNKAEQLVISAKVSIANDFVALKKSFSKLANYGLGKTKNPLNDQIGYKYFTVGQAVRVYLWNKQGMDIPGMSQTDIDSLVAAVESEPEYNVFADELQLIQKQSEYPGPTTNWIVGNIKSDILRGIDTTFRSELLTEWNENIDIAFSDKNMNKLEKAFGSKYVEAIRDSIKRMRSGSNRPTYEGSGSRQVNEMMDWLNGSVAVAMFLNVRSGSLQMLSNVNFINWGDNNIYAAAKAFVSKDYVPTVMKLMNSDYLVNRRDGLKINVNEAELAAAAKQGGFKGMLNYLLDKGFILTRIFDSLAIATGGATFFINRTKANLKRVNAETGKLYTQAEAEAAAFDDFYAIAEETQQSSNPSKISSQQASLFGRVILAFQNVTMQYNRKAKKMLLDFIKRRKRPGMTQRESDLSNLSGVIYYVGVQNLVFNSLQQALFALMFDDEEEREKDKIANTINGMMDSLLFGLGFGGAIVSTVKNVARELNFQHNRKTPKYEEAVWNLFDISPVIDQKVRNVRTALRTFSWNREEIKKRGWSLENPAYLAIAQLISAFGNLPIDRVLRKYNNINQAFDEETRTFERVALLLGWNGWNFGLPYWGRESTIQQELQDEETLKNKFKADVRKAKKDGFTKRVPFTGPNSGKPKGVLGVDYVQIERYDGMIQYYKKP